VKCFGTQSSVVVVLDSSDSTKYSKHVIVRYDGYGFADSSSVCVFIEHLKAYCVDKHPQFTSNHGSIFDTSVYSSNHMFRMYQSHKRKSKRFMYHADFEDGATTCVNQDVLVQSLVTVGVPVQHFRNLDSIRKGGRVLSSGPTADLQEFLEVFERLVGKAYGVIVDGRRIVINAMSKSCAIAGRKHSSNHVYFIIDAATFIYEQRCYSPKCKGSVVRKSLMSIHRDLLVSILPYHRQVSSVRKLMRRNV
jgi:hypothetical protein